jgi:hypothetical protein
MSLLKGHMVGIGWRREFRAGWTAFRAELLIKYVELNVVVRDRMESRRRTRFVFVLQAV